MNATIENNGSEPSKIPGPQRDEWAMEVLQTTNFCLYGPGSEIKELKVWPAMMLRWVKLGTTAIPLRAGGRRMNYY